MYLKDLVDIQMGQSPDSKFYNYDKIGLPFYQGKADFGRINPTPKIWCSKSRKEAKPNDILISVRAPVGDLNINNEQSCIGRGLAAITCRPDVDMMYLYYYLKYLKPQLKHISTGSTFESINRTQLENLMIDYKPYSEQIKISNILQVVERQIEVKENLLILYDLLIKSRFVEIFGDPNMVALNKSVKLSSVAKIITGNTPSRKSPEYYGDYIEWIKSDNIISTNLYISQAKEFLSEQGAAKGRVAPKDSLLMTCIAGSIRSIGNVGICDRSVAFNQQINAIVLKNNINPLYVYWLLKLFKPSIIANVEMSLKGIISKSQLENMLIPIIASQEEQELFIKFALQINKLKFG